MVSKVVSLNNRLRLRAEGVNGVPVKVNHVTNAALYWGLVGNDHSKRDSLLRLVLQADPARLYVTVPYNMVHHCRLTGDQTEDLYRVFMGVDSGEEVL
jgi:hypothetical protein